MARASSVQVVRLATPPAPAIVPAYVFDAFGWCQSDELEWRRPAACWDGAAPIDGADPARMVFVLRSACNFLPCELARLHAFGLGLDAEEALAPWGIDTATDEFYAHRAKPADFLWLAADNVNALFWGLHDWVHFHNHGPFEARAWTELQCDATALAWLWLNREQAPIADAMWERTRQEVVALSGGRFAAEGLSFDPACLAPQRVQGLLAAAGTNGSSQHG